MGQAIRVGIIGAGRPGLLHARGFKEVGGFKIVSVADLIPARRKQVMSDFGATREYADALELVKDKETDAVAICLPNHLHAPIAVAALKSGKHVVCESPPATNANQARKIESAATKAGKTVLYAMTRRFGGAEQAAKQAIEKGYAGEVYHARAAWMRTRGVPKGTGWYCDKAKSGGGAMIDLGAHMLDLAWHLLGEPRPLSVFAVTQARFVKDIEDAAFALIRFDGGKTLELSASWALNQPPQQQGTLCRVYGDKAAIDVYTPNGAVIYRQFNDKGESAPTSLKPPRVGGHAALMRHFKQCIAGQTQPMLEPARAVTLMAMLDAIYRSAESGKSVGLTR